MGGCVSSPNSCVGGKLKHPKNKFVKTRRIRRRRQFRFSDVASFDKTDRSSRPAPPPDRSFTNPVFHGLSLLLYYKCSCPWFLRYNCGLNRNYGCRQMLLCHCSRVLILLCVCERERGWGGEGLQSCMKAYSCTKVCCLDLGGVIFGGICGLLDQYAQ